MLTIEEQKWRALSEAAQQLLEVRPHYSALAKLAHDAWAEQQLEGIDRALGRIQREAKRLASERPGARPQEREAARKAEQATDRYYEARAFTAKIEAEFTNMLSGLMVDPVSPAAERRIAQALTSIRARHGEGAAAHCRKMLPAAELPEPADVGDAPGVPTLAQY